MKILSGPPATVRRATTRLLAAGDTAEEARRCSKPIEEVGSLGIEEVPGHAFSTTPKIKEPIMAFVNVDSAALQKTIDALDGQVKQFRGRTAGRELNNNEKRTLQALEDELEATRELHKQACKAEDEQAQAERRAAFSGWTPEAIAQMNEHLRGAGGLAGAEQAQERAALVQRVLDAPSPSQDAAGTQRALPGGRPSFLSSLRGKASDPALRTIAQAHKRGLLPAAAAAVAERLVMTGDDESRGLASRWAQATGDDKYASAFFKLLGDPQRGHMLWTEEERAAYQRVETVKRELRGMNTSAGYGGALLPLFLDPAVLLTSEGSTNPLRQIARVVQTTSNTWQGVTSAGVTAEWKTEAAEAADATPGTAPAAIPVFFGDAFVPYSYELEQDGLQFAEQLALLLMDAADQLQATAFTTGPGTTAPTGFVTALADTASEVAPTVFETFGEADVYKVQNALPARFQARAQWMAALPTINEIAQFETTNGARLFPEVADGKLLRRTLNECSNMKSTDDVDAAASADNHILCYGDWSNFVIADRIGSMIEIIPQVFGTNGRPTGQRGAFLWFMTGSDVVVPEAFRILNVATSAVS